MRVWEKKLELEPGKDAGLLYKIAGDLLVSHFRRNRVSANVMKEFRFEITGVSPEEDLEYRELQEQYERSLKAMPEKLRIVFLMSRIEELTYREIARRLSISIKAVEKRMSGALARLRTEIRT
jgi:RNA polymerase sigma-70 factor (ECF subfamily)